MIYRNHPAVEAARRALANDETNGCMIEQHEGNGMWTCFAHGMSADGPDMCWYVRDMPPIALNAAREHYTADDLRDTPAGRDLMAEAWKKFQEHYTAEWEEAYPEDIFPTPAPPPAVVSRESVAAAMMRHWAERLRTDRNPYQDGDA